MVANRERKSKSSERTLTIINGFRKPSGIILAHVRNDQGVDYFPRVYPDGTTHCSCAAYDPDKGNGRHQCYHVKGVIEVAHIFGPEGLLIDEIAANAEQANERKLDEYRNQYVIVGDPRVEVAESCCFCGDRCHGGICGKCAA